MRWLNLGLSALTALFVSINGSPVVQRTSDHTSLVVQTRSGKVHGKIDVSNPNVRQFLGIPYAKPPLGQLRFAPPQPLDKTASTRSIEATSLPPSCLQYLGTGASVYTRNVLEFNLQGLNRTGSISEDCLTLSVWTPTIDSTTGCDPTGEKLLPVIIFIYGGGFTTGGMNVPYQIPTQWVQRSRSHLVVSFNYRVNFWGFPNPAGLSPAEQNAGLLDQRAAVEWVQDNIAVFGGDPERITLWGQSAGSESVDLYTYAYPSDPIVTGLIMDSGTAQGISATVAAAADHSSFSTVAAAFGCGNLTSDPSAELACVRNVNATALANYIASHTNLSWRPVANNITVFPNNTARGLAGQQANIPAIIGTNSEDGVPFTTYNPNGVNTTAATNAGLSTFFCPATETTRLRLVTGLPTYRYYYGGNFSNISPTDWLGAYHSSELPMLMGTYGDFRGASSALEISTSEAFQDAYLAFAKGDVESTGWTRYESIGASAVRNFGNVTAGPVQDINVAWLEKRCNGAKVIT